MECQWWLMYRSIMSSIVTEGSNPTASCSPAYYCHALHPTSPSSWTLWAKLVKKECTFRLTRSAFRILSGICESALNISYLILEFGKRNSHLLQSLPNWLQNVSDWLLILTRVSHLSVFQHSKRAVDIDRHVLSGDPAVRHLHLWFVRRCVQ